MSAWMGMMIYINGNEVYVDSRFRHSWLKRLAVSGKETVA